jgi:hypothetical protein
VALYQSTEKGRGDGSAVKKRRERNGEGRWEWETLEERGERLCYFRIIL